MEPDDSIQMRRWEFNAVVLEVVFLVSAALGAGGALLRRAGFPEYVAFAICFGAIGVVQLPILSVYARTRGNELKIGSQLMMIVIGTVVGALIFRFLPR